MKTIVMTGGTSGLGEAAAKIISARPDVRLLIGTRAIQPSGAEAVPLDLASLASARRFAEETIARLKGDKIDALVLNAGLSLSGTGQRTEEGYETAFAVNHLAHYLILRLLIPHLAPNARVVLTASDLHDPALNKMAPPQHADARKLALPVQETEKAEGGFKQGLRAYAASKLCNILTARGLAAQPESQALGLRVVAYNPGFTPGTKLSNSAPLAIRLALAVLTPVIRPLMRLNTVALAGSNLAGLALGEIPQPQGRIYASLVKRNLTWLDPSALAQNDDARDALWHDSATLVNVAN